MKIFRLIKVAFFGMLVSTILLLSGTNTQSQAQALSLSAQTSKNSYKLTEPIVLTLTLSLSAGSPGNVIVDTFEPGTISLVEATLDGQNINPTQTFKAFDEAPEFLQINSLKQLSPGQSVTIPIDVSFSAPGSQFIADEDFPADGTLPVAALFPLSMKGRYSLQFAYQYTGPDGGLPNVFRGQVISNLVAFHLH
jgi:hypothetical protein